MHSDRNLTLLVGTFLYLTITSNFLLLPAQSCFTFNTHGVLIDVKHIHGDKVKFVVKAESKQDLKTLFTFPVLNILQSYDSLSNAGSRGNIMSETGLSSEVLDNVKKDYHEFLANLHDDLKEVYSITNNKPYPGHRFKYLLGQIDLEKLFFIKIGDNSKYLHYKGDGLWEIKIAVEKDGEYQLYKKNLYIDFIQATDSICRPTSNEIGEISRTISEMQRIDVDDTDLSDLLVVTRALLTTSELLKRFPCISEPYDCDKINLLHWLWITNGDVKRNIMDDYPAPEELKEIEQLLSVAKSDLGNLDSILKYSKLETAGSISSVYSERKNLLKTIDRLQERRLLSKERKLKRDQTLLTTSYLYKGFTNIRNRNIINIHHNSLKDLSLYAKMYPKNIGQHIAPSIFVENLNSELTVKIDVKKIDESISLQSLVGLSAIVEGFVISNIPQFNITELWNIPVRYLTDLVFQTVKVIDILSNSSTANPLAFWNRQKLKVGEEPTRISQRITLPDTITTSTKINYSLPKAGSKGELSFGFKYWKNYTLLPFIGVGYSTNRPEEISLIDNKVRSIERGGVDFITGLKLYPLKTVFGDKEFIYSRKRVGSYFDIRKVHMDLGVSLSRPTKDYYFGGGVDLYSGITMSFGYHLMRLQQPKIIKGELVGTKDYTRGSPFISLTFDPATFNNLLIIFGLKKE